MLSSTFPKKIPRAAVRALIVAVACWAPLAMLEWGPLRATGLVRAPGDATGGAGLRWTGALEVPSASLYDLALEDGRCVHVAIGGQTAVRRLPGANAGEIPVAPEVRRIWLHDGFQSIVIDCGPGAIGGSVTWGEAGTSRTPIESATLLPTKPGHPALRAFAARAVTWLRIATWAALAIGALTVISVLCGALRRRLEVRNTTDVGARFSRAAAVALPLLLVGVAAAVRFDALTETYGLVESPGWVRSAQERLAGPLAAARPPGVRYEPAPLYPHKNAPATHYISDPYTYIDYAKRMRSFYAAHYREPIFVFSTKVWLWVLRGQDVAVSFSSASFSVLAVLATYLLGSAAFSRWVGAGAALALALETHAVTEGISGGRDDAFMFVVALFAWAIVRWWKRPGIAWALAAGAIGGAACLVRITAVTFVVPGFIVTLLLRDRSWQLRLRDLGLAVLACLVVAAPYLINCWVAFGDPLYAINVHANVYRVTEGAAVDPRATAASYVKEKLLARPVQMLGTVLAGFTSYPFSNKWDGFAWLPGGAAQWLQAAAILGLLLFPGSWPGRLMLLVLVSSLVPYAVTWRTAPEWRFTQHTYPFDLIASSFGVWAVVRFLGAFGSWLGSAPPRPVRWRIPMKQAAGWLLVVATAAGLYVLMTEILPRAIVPESVAAGEDVSVEADSADGVFFTSGWSAPAADGGVTFRVATTQSPEVLVPLPRADEYSVTLRLDPFPRPLAGEEGRLPSIQVILNDKWVSRIDTRRTPGRVGAYEVTLPRGVTKAALNRMKFVVSDAPAEDGASGTSGVRGIAAGTTIQVWYIRVHPPRSAAPTS